MDKFSYLSSSPSPSFSPFPPAHPLLPPRSQHTDHTQGWFFARFFFFNVCFCFGFGGNQGRSEIAPYGAELKTEAQPNRAPGLGDSCDNTGLALG